MSKPNVASCLLPAVLLLALASCSPTEGPETTTVNLGGETFRASRGERIAQLVIAAAPQVAVEEVAELDGTERGAGGFGSTGR